MKSSAPEASVSKAVTPRSLAWLLLQRVVGQGHSLKALLDGKLDRLAIDRDRGFCAEICFGVCRYYFVLQNELAGMLTKPLKSRDQDIRLLLLMGLYQLRFMRVSHHAAVNETVALLAGTRKNWATGLVNGVLRNYIRRLASGDAESATELTGMEQVLAYPEWLRQRIEHDWGERAASVMSAGNRQAPLVIRVDTATIARDAYVQQLAREGITARDQQFVDSALVLAQPVPVTRLPGFAEGRVSVQDAAAQLAAGLLNCRPGMRVLDACAAPGGKALHLLQSCPDIDLLALDRDAERLARVEENLQRAGRHAVLVNADAAQPQGWFSGQPFERILLDAPCSASGIIRRHPDIRLLRRPDDIDALVAEQAQLLDALWPLLRPGGLLLYSTCSIFKNENEDQVTRFLQQHEDCVERPINTVQWGQDSNPGRQILPGINDMDGFYYARLEKKT